MRIADGRSRVWRRTPRTEINDAPDPQRGQANHQEHASVKHQRSPGALVREPAQLLTIAGVLELAKEHDVPESIDSADARPVQIEKRKIAGAAGNK